MICPKYKAAMIIAGTYTNDDVQCDQAECAWWVSPDAKYHECAIPHIAKSLWGLTGIMDKPIRVEKVFQA